MLDEKPAKRSFLYAQSSKGDSGMSTEFGEP